MLEGAEGNAEGQDRLFRLARLRLADNAERGRGSYIDVIYADNERKMR